MKYLAPAKINLNLIIQPRDAFGLHPLFSVVQSIEWCDELSVVEAEEDSLVVEGADLSEGPDNLVVRAIGELRDRVPIPALEMKLAKTIPIGSGLGGGSADAAAALIAGCDVTNRPHRLAADVAPDVGADVSFPIVGGTAEMSGYGEQIRPLPSLEGFALAVVAPEFPISTASVYQRWDDLGGPEGFELPDRFLPPVLRSQFPVRNDLFRAAVEVEPMLGDFVADVGKIWDGAALLTGSGSACFGFFSTEEEAEQAAAAVPRTRAARGVSLRRKGVERIED